MQQTSAPRGLKIPIPGSCNANIRDRILVWKEKAADMARTRTKCPLLVSKELLSLTSIVISLGCKDPGDVYIYICTVGNGKRSGQHVRVLHHPQGILWGSGIVSRLSVFYSFGLILGGGSDRFVRPAMGGMI